MALFVEDSIAVIPVVIQTSIVYKEKKWIDLSHEPFFN